MKSPSSLLQNHYTSCEGLHQRGGVAPPWTTRQLITDLTHEQLCSQLTSLACGPWEDAGVTAMMSQHQRERSWQGVSVSSFSPTIHVHSTGHILNLHFKVSSPDKFFNVAIWSWVDIICQAMTPVERVQISLVSPCSPFSATFSALLYLFFSILTLTLSI